MKEKITGIISLLGSVLFIFLTIEEMTSGTYYLNVVHLLTLISCVSVILYVLWTKFGKLGNSDLHKIEYDNKVLQKKIEQKELMKKLEQ